MEGLAKVQDAAKMIEIDENVDFRTLSPASLQQRLAAFEIEALCHLTHTERKRHTGGGT